MPDIEEQQIYEALGVTPSWETGANEQGFAEPVPEPLQADAETDVIEQEPTTLPGGEDAGDDESEKQKNTADTQSMTPEERKANAAERRRKEQQAAIDEAVQKAITAEREKTGKELVSFFREAKLENTITGAPITNMDEFNEWRQAYDSEKLQNDLKAGKLTPEGLNKAISENPLVKRAEEIIKMGEEDRRRQEMAAARARVDAELAEIRKLDPTIKEAGDLLKMPGADQFYEYVKKGNSFVDAFYLTNRERLQSQAAASARQQAMSNTRSKDHLTATSARGGGAASVPPEDMELFRALNPKASEAEIQLFYNKKR